MADSIQGGISGLVQLLRQPRQLELMIRMNPDCDQQAELWHAAAEIFEGDVEYPDHWDQAIDCYGKAIGLVSKDDDRRSIFLHHLGSALMGRAESGGSVESDIRMAIDAMIEVLELTLEQDPNYKIFVANYGDAMFRLSQETGSPDDFEKGVALMKKAVELADDDDPNLSIWYTKLRDELFNRSESTGATKDLASAFELYGEDTPYKNEPAALFQLSALLQRRHLSTGSMLDLDNSITILDKLFIDMSDDENYGSILSLLGNSLRIRGRRTNSVPDCDRSIELQERMLKWMEQHQNATPERRATCLGSIASALVRRYFLTGQDEHDYHLKEPETDLDRAIRLYAEAVELTPKDSRNLGNLLGTLGNAILGRYEKRKSLEDLDAIISTFDCALKLQTAEYQAQSLCCLGRALHFRARSTDSDPDWELAIQTYERAAMCHDSPLSYRIMAADDGGNCIFYRDAYRASRLFELAVNLLPAVSPRSLIRADRRYNLSLFDGTVWSAVSACLEIGGDVYKAVQLTELGEALSQICNSISAPTSPHLASSTRIWGSASLKFATPSVQSRRSWKTVQIRLPVVLTRLGVLPRNSIRCSPQYLKHEDVLVYAQQFIEAITTRSVKRYAESNRKMKKVLEWLWDVAVSHVLQELGMTETPGNDDDWPRVWWVRAGLFSLFPIHAAGYHEVEPRISAIDRVISSYTPTIKSLAHARSAVQSIPAGDQQILVVGMPTTPEQDDLLPVEQEMDELAKLFPCTPSTMFKRNPERREVFPILREIEIFHFSGHGFSSASDPSLSCLLLNDWKTEPLSVSNLRSLEIQNGRFAYLSACHSASSVNSGLRLLDESIHISSAFQLAGFRSVVATLWYVYADHSTTVAKQLYSLMLDRSNKLQSERSAVALHHTVRSLRDELRTIPGMRRQGPDNPLVWAAYILTGV